MLLNILLQSWLIISDTIAYLELSPSGYKSKYLVQIMVNMFYFDVDYQS